MDRRALFTNFRPVWALDEPVASCGSELYPNPVLKTHEGHSVRLYDDLLKGKQVVINMMYANCESLCSTITSGLVKVHDALKARMGRDLHMYSISIKPEEDSPAALKSFAEMHGALLPGWTFLTGDPYDIETIRFRFFRMNHIKLDTDLNSHTAMLRIINETTNTWTSVVPTASLYTVLQHISWADPPKSLEQRLEDNRRLQQQIDKEVREYGYRKIV